MALVLKECKHVTIQTLTLLTVVGITFDGITQQVIIVTATGINALFSGSGTETRS